MLDAEEEADPRFMQEVCKIWFSSRSGKLESCQDSLDRAAVERATVCPRPCWGLFSAMPPKCGRALRMSLRSDLYAQHERGTPL